MPSIGAQKRAHRRTIIYRLRQCMEQHPDRVESLVIVLGEKLALRMTRPELATWHTHLDRLLGEDDDP